MKQRRLYLWIYPRQRQTQPSRRPTKMVLLLALLLSLFFIGEPYTRELGKKVEIKPKATVVVPTNDEQPKEQIKPVKPEQTPFLPAPVIWEKGTQIKWQVLSTGGTKGNSSSYQIGNTVSQTAIGCGGSSSYQLCQGFLVGSYGGGGFVRGDATGDGVIDAGDVVYMINYLYRGGYPPDPLEAGDTTCDGNVDAGDVVYLVNYLYRNGPAPSC
jgi:hypothetical protein